MKHKEIAQQWLNGAEIEVYSTTSSKWMPLKNEQAAGEFPRFCDEYDYRVKPAPVKTPCEKLGYKVGDLFLMIDPDGTYSPAVVRLDRDDDTDLPYFRHIAGGNGGYQFNETRYCRLSWLTKFTV